MMLPAQRRCDVCGEVIEPGVLFVSLRYELREDNKPTVGSAGGGSIPASNELDAHERCCAPDFAPLLDLRRRQHNVDRTQRNRWSHENVPMDPGIAAAIVGMKGKSR